MAKIILEISQDLAQHNQVRAASMSRDKHNKKPQQKPHWAYGRNIEAKPAGESHLSYHPPFETSPNFSQLYSSAPQDIARLGQYVKRVMQMLESLQGTLQPRSSRAQICRSPAHQTPKAPKGTELIRSLRGGLIQGLGPLLTPFLPV